ncbi:MAG TPA: acyltransferase, partial [Oleiagrimonas sp.]|nr:acyltransferase [Oleiagrimonas sp.]
GTFLVLEKWLRWCINPRLRARFFGLLGAEIGNNVRIYEVQLFNLASGLNNLHLADDVHVGPGGRLDLEGPLRIGPRSTLSPGVTILTHADPGTSHHSALSERYPPHASGVRIGSDCWIGTNAVLLDGITIGDRSVVGAGAVVTRDIESDSLAVGIPARIKTARPS